MKTCTIFFIIMKDTHRPFFKSKLKASRLVLKNVAGSHSCLRNVKLNVIFQQKGVHNVSTFSFIFKKKTNNNSNK